MPPKITILDQSRNYTGPTVPANLTVTGDITSNRLVVGPYVQSEARFGLSTVDIFHSVTGNHEGIGEYGTWYNILSISSKLSPSVKRKTLSVGRLNGTYSGIDMSLMTIQSYRKDTGGWIPDSLSLSPASGKVYVGGYPKTIDEFLSNASLHVYGGIYSSASVSAGGNVSVNNNNSYLLTDTTGYTPYLTCQNDNNLILYSTETSGIASNVDVNGNYPSGQTQTFLTLMWDNAGVAQITWTPTSSKLLFRVGQSVTITGDWNASSNPAYTQAQIKEAMNTTQIVTESAGNYIKFVTSITGYPGIIYFANQQSPGSYVTNASIIPTLPSRAAFALIARDSTSSLQLLPGGGNVGIGTGSPVAALHVKGYDYTGTTTQSLWTTIKVEGVSATAGAALVLNNWQIAGRGSNSPPASGLSFYDTNTSAFRMVINSSGQVGIGTTAPTSLLTVNGNADIGQGLNLGVLSNGYPPYSVINIWSKRLSTDTLPNQTIRWTWYADSNSSVGIGDRTLQLWAYPYSSAVPSSLAIFDQWLRFQYPTFTETTISVGNLNPQSGILVSRGTIGTGSLPYHVAIHSTGKFLYVINSASNTVQTYTINQSTGDLISRGTIATGNTPNGVACDPTGKFLYVTNANSDNVQNYTINQSTGDLTSRGTIAAGRSPVGIACDPTGKFVYVANRTDNTVQTYTINQSTGDLTSRGTTGTGTGPWGVACDPTGKFLYVTNNNAGSLYTNATVSSYTINQSTGDLTSRGTIAAGLYPRGVVCDPTGKFLYVVNYYSNGPNGISIYTINQSTGDLTSQGTAQAGAIPWNVACDPTGMFLYVTNYGDGTNGNTVSSYIINQSTGALTSTGATATGSYPIGVACDPTGKFVYVTNGNSNTVQTYTITQLTGNLTVGGRYIITNLGTTTQAQWNTIAGQSGNTYVVGSWFNAATTGVEAVGTTGQVLYQSYTRKTSIYTDLDVYGATTTQGIANTGSNSSGLSILNKNTSGGSGAYSIYMQGNDLNDNRFVIFTNSSTRTNDGGAGNTTLRTDYGQLRLSSASNGLYISSGLNFAITSISAATTLNDTHLVVLAGGTTSYTVTLPAGASSNTGRTYYIKKTSTSSYTLTIAPTSPSTIDGATSISFTAQYMSYTVVSDGANWFVI